MIAIYALVVGAALLVVAALAVQLTRSQLQHQLETRMVAVATSFAEGPAAGVRTAEQLPEAARSWLETQPAPADQAVIVRTSAGEMLSARSGLSLGDVEGSAALLDRPTTGWSTLSDPDGDVRALTVPLTLGEGGSEAGVLVVAASTDAVDAGVSDLIRQVLWACAAGFVLAVVLGLLAVRRTLRPLQELAADIDRLPSSRDVSQRVRVSGPADEVGRLGLAFNRTLDRLQQVVASQRQFVADASHELRTPLTVARGQLELLADGVAASAAAGGADPGKPGDDPGARETASTTEMARSVDIAVGELDRMGRMVRDLLLLARLDEGLELRREPVDVELVLGDAVLRALPAGGSHAAAAEVEVDVPPGLAVRADPEGLLQVMTNLLVNAGRHGGRPARVGPQIGVAARRHGDEVVIAVADNGRGIAPDDVPHVFERFYRGQGRRDHDGGTGLGLAIAKGLTERMGGRITVAATSERGTTFTVQLPAAAGEPAGDDG